MDTPDELLFAFWMLLPAKEMWRSTQKNNTRSSHRSCKVQWGGRWDFRTFIV